MRNNQTARDVPVFCSRRIAGALCAFLLIATASSIWKWPEFRGVYDDICYLRQAHLFQRFGLAGMNTDISRDDDRVFSEMQKAIGYPGWADPNLAPCHSRMPGTGKLVLQYPPGTGFALSLFPRGFQARYLYISVGTFLLLISLLAIGAASTTRLVAMAGALGFAAIYFMVNPTKASYSMAPTMLICAVAGYLTSILPRARWPIPLLGILLGLAVNFRLANLFLSFGYCACFAYFFIRTPSQKAFCNGLMFAGALMIGMSPTLAANWVNAGSPFATTYSGADSATPGLSLDPLMSYLTDLQGGLTLLAGAGVVWIMLARTSHELRFVALLTITNVAANIAFFLTHAIVTQYYVMPIAMLSLWSLMFATLNDAKIAAEVR